jgi:aspartyl-tRNA(Asn)/glutamyl-tRNA(Gln) amidotransferase subunit C
MRIDKKTVEHVALLSRIKLHDAEKEIYSHQLTKILDYVEQLNKVDTKDVKPTHQIAKITSVMREDKVEPSGKEKSLIHAAPQKEQGFIKVKAVFE